MPLTAEDAAREQQEQAGGHSDTATPSDLDGENADQEAQQARRDRIRQRQERHERQGRSGASRFRPGPGRDLYAPRMSVADTTEPPETLDDEIESIACTLAERGALSETGLSRALKAGYWGPGRFRRALREAVAEGRAVRLSHGRYGPPKDND